MHRPPSPAARTSRDRGFSLVELLVVVIVIAVLAAFAVGMFLNQRRKAVDASVKADLHRVAIAFETWNATNPEAATDPSLTTADISAGLRAAGFRHTPNTVVWIAKFVNGTYCFGVLNNGGTRPSAPGYHYMWYSTTGGGLVQNGAYLTWDQLTALSATGCRGLLATSGGYVSSG